MRAHRRCRRAASKIGRARPPRWRAAGRKAAHTPNKSLTRAVFHAPMSALNALAVANACKPSRTRSTPVERTHTFGRGYVCPQTHMHAQARARMCDVGACVGHARIGDAFFYEALRMDVDMCIYHEYKYCICVCSL